MVSSVNCLLIIKALFSFCFWKNACLFQMLEPCKFHIFLLIRLSFSYSINIVICWKDIFTLDLTELIKIYLMVCTIGILFKKSFLLFVKILSHISLSNMCWFFSFTFGPSVHLQFHGAHGVRCFIRTVTHFSTVIHCDISSYFLDLLCFIHILNSHVNNDLLLSCLFWDTFYFLFLHNSVFFPIRIHFNICQEDPSFCCFFQNCFNCLGAFILPYKF